MSLHPLGSTVLAPSIVAVQPVVDRGRVWMRWLVEEVSAHSFCGWVTSWMKHTPPHVLLTGRSWRLRSSGTPRNRWHSFATAPFSYTFDVNGLGGDLIAEASKAMLRLRSGNSFIPHFSCFCFCLVDFGENGVKLRKFVPFCSLVELFANMENQEVSCECDELPLNHIGDEEEFRSCCGDEEVWLKESDDSAKVAEEEKNFEIDDEFSVKMFFKGVSISERGDSGSGYSGIGVVLERSGDFELIQIQKKLEFYVEESVANYLALMDGLEVALQNNLRSVVAVTGSELLYNQITREEQLEIPLLVALRERVLEKTSNLDGFVLKLAPFCDLDEALSLAQVAVGIVSSNLDEDKPTENCSICCEDRQSEMMLTLKCTHKFCSHCMKTYVEGKVQSSEVPIRCPQVQCKHYLSATECKSFLPVATFKSFEEANVRSKNNGKIYCPYPNCSFLLDPQECLSSGRASSSSSTQSENSCCVECPVCERFVCVDCGVPWHASMSCEEFQILPVDERYPDDITLHRLARYKRWRRCQQCRIMIELAQGCNHMTCRCGHEFCYSCGAEYREGQQTCTCAFWDDDEEDQENSVEENTIQEVEHWPWDTFSTIPTVIDAYSEQERSQLALIQRFLAGGGFSLSDHQTSSYQSPPPCTESSYVEAAMKDLHQLPWLERFVSVISDDYYEEYNSQ